jgi:hypothetical protein
MYQESGFLHMILIVRMAFAVCMVSVRRIRVRTPLKGTVSRDFRPSVFFIKHCPKGYWFTG